MVALALIAGIALIVSSANAPATTASNSSHVPSVASSPVADTPRVVAGSNTNSRPIVNAQAAAEAAPAGRGRLTFVPTNPATLAGEPDYLAPTGVSWVARTFRSQHSRSDIQLDEQVQKGRQREGWGGRVFPPPSDRLAADKQALLDFFAAEHKRNEAFQVIDVEFVGSQPLYFWRATSTRASSVDRFIIRSGLATSIEEVQQDIRAYTQRVQVDLECVYDFTRAGTRLRIHAVFTAGNRRTPVEQVFDVWNVCCCVAGGPDEGAVVLFEKMMIGNKSSRELGPTFVVEPPTIPAERELQKIPEQGLTIQTPVGWYKSGGQLNVGDLKHKVGIAMRRQRTKAASAAEHLELGFAAWQQYEIIQDMPIEARGKMQVDGLDAQWLEVTHTRTEDGSELHVRVICFVRDNAPYFLFVTGRGSHFAEHKRELLEIVGTVQFE